MHYMQIKFIRIHPYFFYKFVVIILSLSVLGACDQFFYEEATDNSKFISAKLMQNDIVLFSYAHTAYRMAKGIAAFPDGGKAKYVVDNNILGTYKLKTDDISIIKNEKNMEWHGGSGNFTIILANGSKALISQSGQRKDTFKHMLRYWMVDVQSGSIEAIPLQSELQDLGRALGHMYMIRNDGTLLLISPSIEQKARTSNWSREASIVPELWVRYADGDYVKIGASRHYERMRGNEVIYWIPQTRQFKSFDLISRKNKYLAGYKYPPYEDVSIGVSIGDMGQTLELGHKRGGKWEYTPIAIDSEILKK